MKPYTFCPYGLRLNRPAECSAEIVLPFLFFCNDRTQRSVEPMVGIEGFITKIIEGRTVPVVGPGTRGKGELSARGSAIFSRISGGCSPELLQRIHGYHALRCPSAVSAGVPPPKPAPTPKLATDGPTLALTPSTLKELLSVRCPNGAESVQHGGIVKAQRPALLRGIVHIENS